MARKGETLIVENIRKYILSIEPSAHIYKVYGSGYSKKGEPDLLVCFRGRFVGLEVKDPKNKSYGATKLQLQRLKEIEKAGGISAVVTSPLDVELLFLSKGLLGLEPERWVKIEDFPRYSISSWGRVRIDGSRIKSDIGKIKKPFLSKDGYYRIELKNKKGRKKFNLSRLVALHFIPNPGDKEQVDHINGDRLFNYYKNLRWVTLQENLTSPLREVKVNKRVICINTGKVFNTITEAAESVGLTRQSISFSCRNYGYSAGKDSEGNRLYWRFYDDQN